MVLISCTPQSLVPIASLRRVIDLFREWDSDGDGKISKKEFRRAMPMLGFDVPVEDIDKLFNENDPDGSGEMEFKELKRMLAPRRGRAAKDALSSAKTASSVVSAMKKGAGKSPNAAGKQGKGGVRPAALNPEPTAAPCL